jgi:O-antigen/teichoic acid export membrane protein
MGFNLLRDVLQFMQMVVLARLLPTDAYGLFAYSTSVIGLIAVFAAPAFLSYTLQEKSDSNVNYQLHFTAAVAIQLIVFFAANVAALVLYSLPQYAPAGSFVQILSLTFLLDAACELRRKMIERNMDFRTLRLLHALGLTLATIASISMGALGCGAYSLVVPTLLVTFPFIYDLFVRERWRPTWEFSWREYRPAFLFGSTRIGAGALSQGRVMIESTVLTAILGFATLGVFNRAVGLATLVCTKISSQLLYAIYPMLTRLDVKSGQASRVGNVLIAIVAWIVIPAGVAVTWCATPAILTVYGGQWKGVIPLLGWTIGLAMLSAFSNVSYQLLLARNYARICLVSDCVWLVGTCVSLWMFLPMGTIHYLASQAFVQLVLLIALCVVLIRVESISYQGLFDAFVPPILCVVVATATASFMAGQSFCLPLSPFDAIVWGILFALVYSLGIRFLFARLTSNLLRYLPGQSRLRRILLLPV